MPITTPKAPGDLVVEWSATIDLKKKAGRDIITCREALDGLNRLLAVREAQIWLGAAIDGKNAETRQAQFVIACEQDAEWKRFGLERDQAKKGKDLAELDYELCKDSGRLYYSVLNGLGPGSLE